MKIRVTWNLDLCFLIMNNAGTPWKKDLFFKSVTLKVNKFCHLFIVFVFYLHRKIRYWTWGVRRFWSIGNAMWYLGPLACLKHFPNCWLLLGITYHKALLSMFGYNNCCIYDRCTFGCMDGWMGIWGTKFWCCYFDKLFLCIHWPFHYLKISILKPLTCLFSQLHIPSFFCCCLYVSLSLTILWHPACLTN